MIIDVQKFYSDFFNNGFYKINDPQSFRFFPDIEICSWNNLKEQGLQLIKRDIYIEQAIKLTQKYIGENYIKMLDADYQLGEDCEIVNGMDGPTLVWHNDAIEGYNLCVLLYFDTVDEDIGGKLSFREITTKSITGEFYPQKYDVAFLNHCHRFEHKVEDLKLPLPRRVASFNFHVNKLITG